MPETIPKALLEVMTLHGNRKRAVAPGTAFATIPPEEEFYGMSSLADMKYPPIHPDNPGCIFDEDRQALVATAWGRIVLTDAGVRIRPSWKISRDKMLLSVEVSHEDFSGDLITLERLKDWMPGALKEVASQFDYSKVEVALEEAARSGRNIAVTVAEGQFPGEGRDASFKLTFDVGQGAGTLREDGSMDFRERSDLHSVGEGDELGTLHPPVHGSYGSDVFGNPIKPADVATVRVNVGQGVESSLEEDGSTVYTAARTGMARYRNGLLEVVELVEISGDVDFSTGNIHAKHGSVRIRGDVKCGFCVECEEDVIVDGVVEEADIVAGGLVVAGGVIMNNKNFIKAEGDVSAHFFRNARIRAGGDVNADQEISHSTVEAGGKVQVLGGKGIISGGHIVSGDTIHAKIIGNKACIPTVVEIRLPSPDREKLQAARRDLENELEELDKAIGVDFEISSLMNAPEEDRRILAELIKIRERIHQELRTIDEVGELTQEQARKLAEAKRIKADQQAFCGVEAIICGMGHRVEKDLNTPSFRLDTEKRAIVWS